MIARIWKGLAKVDRAEDYINHLRKETLPILSNIDGFIEMKIGQRPAEDAIEFLVMTVWEDLSRIKEFADLPIDQAVVPTYVQELMISYDPYVRHYEWIS